jgi:hypothetical protein
VVQRHRVLFNKRIFEGIVSFADENCETGVPVETLGAEDAEIYLSSGISGSFPLLLREERISEVLTL